MSRIVIVPVAAAVALRLVLPVPVGATQRFASPSGGGDCSTTPCSLETAITGATSGDEVIVGPGTYDVAATIEATVPLRIHGAAGQPRPRIVGAPTVNTLKSFETLDLSDLRIESTDSDIGSVFVVGAGSIFSRLELLATATDSALTLRPGTDFTLRDSLLRSSGGMFSGAVFVQGVATGSATIRNVTAIASGSESTAISVTVVNPSATVTMDVKNVIADAATDFSANAPQGTVVFTVGNSNFDTGSGITEGPGNQTAPPVFVNPAAGDYHEAAGSPTIDAGTADPENGSSDLDGNARTIGSAPDIGAFEFEPPSTITTTTTTTTTTLPCIAEATFASVACRLAGLAADVSAQVSLGALRDKLLSALRAAEMSAQEASDAATRRARRRALHRGTRALAGCRSRLRSRVAKSLDASLRHALVGRVVGIKRDVKTLSKS